MKIKFSIYKTIVYKMLFTQFFQQKSQKAVALRESWHGTRRVKSLETSASFSLIQLQNHSQI